MRKQFGKTIVRSGIYRIINIRNRKSYIGSSCSISRRIFEHKKTLKEKRHRNPYLQNAFNKYGEDAFEFKILLYCNKENLLFYEQKAINNYKSANGRGYNLSPTAGSPLGVKHSIKARKIKSHIMRKRMLLVAERRKISRSLLGHVVSSETKQKISKANKGKKMSYKLKIKLFKINKGAKRSKKTKLKMSKSQKGRKHTEESKKKMSKSRIGMKFTKEHRKNISIAVSKNQIGRKHSEETKKKMSKSAKGRNHSKETKEKLRRIVTGRKWSIKAKENMSKATTKWWRERKNAA